MFHPIREMPIIDETGAFRLARGHGIVQAKTHFFNLTSGMLLWSTMLWLYIVEL